MIAHVIAGELGRAQLLTALDAAGVGRNVSAETLLARPEFDAPAPVAVTVVTRTLAELGLPEGATLPALLSAVERCGLALLPLTTGPALRLATLDQPSAPDAVMSNGRAPSGSVTVLSAPLDGRYETPKGFYLRVIDGRPWLRGYRCDDTHVHAADMVVAVGAPAG